MEDRSTVAESSVLLGARGLIGFIFLWHGVPKVWNVDRAMEAFAAMGLPGALGPVIGAVEVIAAVLVIIGLGHRLANLALALVILGALVLVQLPGGMSAGLERDLLILAATSFLAVRGPGRFAASRLVGASTRSVGRVATES